MRTIIAKLDKVADLLESKGLIKEAEDIDIISNTLEREATVLDVLKKIPGINTLGNLIDFRNPKATIFKIVKALGGKVDPSVIEEGKNLLAKMPGGQQPVPAAHEAALFDAMRSGKKAIMGAVLVAFISGLSGKAYAQTSLADIDKFIQQNQQEYVKYQQDMQEGQAAFNADQKKKYDNFVRTGDIPPEALEDVDPSKVSKDKLKSAPVVESEGSDVAKYTPAQVSGLADSVINEDAEALSEYLKFPFDIRVKTVDNSKLSAKKLEELSKVTGVDITTLKSIKSEHISFKANKNTNSDLFNTLNQVIESKENIDKYTDKKTLEKLIQSAFLKKIAKDKVMKDIWGSSQSAKDKITEAVIYTAQEMATNILM